MKNRLITLLTMGRMLDRAKDRTGAYSLRKLNKFPKVGPVARPAAATAPAPAPVNAPAAQASLFVAQPGPVSPKDLTDRSDPTDRTAQAKVAAPPPPPKARSPWRPKLKAFLPKIASEIWRKFRAPAAKTATCAQAELALDKVTVQRNDLSDADLVVVAVKRKLMDARAAQSEAVAPAGNAWTRVTARWGKLKEPAEGAPAVSAVQAGRPSELAQTPP